ncbi:hypothetical protein [Hymenobacter persicinus]|uniref:Uncharacterized protein n=1 Tax=Hymenobacter persicinus TaxID=2025506 RepID=A0A4Q5L8J2_9BACT|nr:hypothetical protein [Hymenobacter persicinus]RYU77967.1 hypothetical protein EWM57_15870 [Hymenobacter persicinus]
MRQARFKAVKLLRKWMLKHHSASALNKQVLTDYSGVAQITLGGFAYDESGFQYATKSGVGYHKWTDLETAFGYKVDLYTTDEICLDLFFSKETRLTLTESTPGWYQFLDRLAENIPSVPREWNLKIAAPAFEIQLTLLFDKAGRNQEQAEVACYKA